ncbi:MAG TPA: VWA domain-containing protein [Candidatus Dormibacteraeota bacterium]|nr:VWA domain-containing protein [Candidatus Dormibacteraeota bacterium]
MHAAVIDVKTGEVLRRSDWYLHDRRQYLWPLAAGKMLLRQGDSLLELDQNLTEKVVLEHGDLFWTDVTPDGKQIVAGTTIDKTEIDKKVVAQKSHPLKYEVRFWDATSLKLLGTIPIERPIPLSITGAGYADVVLKHRWTWVVRIGGRGPRRAITRVRSSCIPDVQVSGENTLLVGRCTTAQDRYVMSSFSTDGHFLWRQHWPDQLNTPTITRSASGSRFALATVDIVKESIPDSANSEENSREARRHKIEVFNAATGTSVLRLVTQPAISVGGNIALSPLGATLAVLRDTHVELYHLPALEKKEAAKLAAIRAGTPGLTPPNDASDQEDPEWVADEDFSAPQLATFAAAAQDVPAPPIAGNTSDPKETRASTSAVAKAQSYSSPELVIHSRATAVTVDVVVTDSKGHPVPGLKADDFTVAEDGTAQKVDYFKEHSVIETHIAPAPVFKHPPNIFSNVSNTTQPDSATLILLDLLNTEPLDQGHARNALTKYIKTKPANESFALCVLDSAMHLVRGFTADENELLLAMNDRRAKPGSTLNSQLDSSSLRFIRSVTQQLDSPSDISRSFAIATAGLERAIQDEQMSQNDMRTYMTIHAFEELARYMAGVPGRKKVLWLSAAFPLGQFPAQGGLDAGAFHGQRNFIPLISKTMNLLASAHVSVYPVDIRGVQINSIADVAEERPFTQDLPNSPLTSPSGTGQQTVAGGNGIDASASANTRNLANDHVISPDGFIGRAVEDSTQRNSEHSAMDLVAEQTGGKAFYGSNDITQAVRTVVEQGTDYYTVSYTPTNHRYDGRFRKIRVKVAGRGYRIAHRSGYYAEDPNRPPEKSEAVLRSLSVAGMMHGAPESRQIPFETRIVPIGEPKTVNAQEAGIQREGKSASSTVRLQHYRVDYAIPGASLRFDPRPEGGFHGSFRLLANSYGADGQGMLQAAITEVADLTPENYRSVLSEGLRLRQEFDVPADASFLRLGVADMSTSYIGTLELPLPVPTPKSDPLARREGSLPPVEPD